MLSEACPPAESVAGFCTRLSNGMDRLRHARCKTAVVKCKEMRYVVSYVYVHPYL